MYINKVNEDIHFSKSLKFLQLSNYQSAIDSINLAIANNTNKSFYRFQKIKILFVAKMLTQCSDYIENYLLNLYKYSSLHIFSKILSYYKDSTKGSVASLEKLLCKNNIPTILASEFEFFINNPSTDLMEQIVHFKEAGNYIKCIDYCDLVLSKDASNITCYLIKARSYCLIGENELGITTYKKVIELESKTSSIYSELGTVMMNLEHYPEAISCFDSALSLDPSNLYFMTELAEAYHLWKKYDNALTYYKRVLKKTPRCNEVLLRIANLYEQTNKPKKAKKVYKKILA